MSWFSNFLCCYVGIYIFGTISLFDLIFLSTILFILVEMYPCGTWS